MNALLSTRQLTLHRNQRCVGNTIDFNLNSGEIWGLLGPNGSGKTTFLHAIAQLHTPTQGQLLLHGKPYRSYSKKQFARHVGILFQKASFSFSQTVFEFCRTGRFPALNPLQDEEFVWHALEAMELTEKAWLPIEQLSGGEQQRLRIATLLAQTPECYLLDEPFNHLDIRQQWHVMECFKHYSSQSGILLALHDITLARQFCTHVLLLGANGQCQQGTAKELLTSETLSHLFQHPISCE